jgi:hypothetical protein
VSEPTRRLARERHVYRWTANNQRMLYHAACSHTRVTNELVYEILAQVFTRARALAAAV